MKAIKGNRVYKVNEGNKKIYTAQGFDIVDDNGKVIEASPVKTVPYAEYAALKAEYEDLKKSLNKAKGGKGKADPDANTPDTDPDANKE